ncbi:hypothetical protein MMC13_000814 [Lambiella insularis]|nr:hypothetical protein [Lambiella insularis]
MPWRPLPRIAFAVAIYPFQPSHPADLPLELGDELYIIEEGGLNGSWYRGYLVAPPSLLAGLTCIKGQTLEARVFSGIFPKNCVEIREVLGDGVSNGFTQEERQGNGHNEKDISEAESRSPTSRDGPASVERINVMNSTRQNNTSFYAQTSPPLVRRSSQLERSGSKGQERNGDITRKTSPRLATPQKSPILALPLTPVSMSPGERGATRPPAPVPMLKIGDETPTSSSEPLVDEIASCLREWHSTNLHELLLSRQYAVLDKLSKLVHQLDLARRQLLHGVLTKQELEKLREQTVWNLVNGNKMLSNEIIVRDPKQRGRLLTGDDTAIEISKLQSSMSLLDKPPVQSNDRVNLHHLLFEFRGLASQGRESPSLSVSLYSKKLGEPPRQLTESFSVDISVQDQLGKAPVTAKFRTLFSDLTSSDIGGTPGSDINLYIVVKVQTNRLTQAASLAPSRATTQRESTPTTETNGSSGSPGNSTLRSGRRSLMWGQSKSGRSQRHPSNATSKLSRSSDGTGSNPSIEEEEEQKQRRDSRPTTSTIAKSIVPEGPQYVKRNVGIAVGELKQFLAHEGDLEQILTVWSPNEMSLETQDIEQGGDELIQELLSCSSRRLKKSKAFNRIRLQLHSFVSSDADALIRKTPTLLHNILKTPKMGFSGAPTKPRSDIYISLSSTHLPGQALFSHPEKGATQLATSLDMHNIQLTLEVRKGTGERVEHCIFPSSNSAGHTAWRTSAIDRGEAWNQTIKLVIPPSDVPDAHLIMSIADAPGFPFALGWMPLWDHKAFIRDGKHSPLLYLYDGVTSHTENGRGAYLDYPWDSKARDSIPHIESLRGPVAVLRLESYLCSTEFSQDQVLLGVLRWRDQPEDQLLVMLRQLVFVPEIEIVKVVSDLFDALFCILVDRSGNDEYEDLVFNDIVTVLGIVHDRRFDLGPLVNEYADNRFNYPFATPCLIRSYLRLLSTPADYQNSRNLRATFKVGQQVLKFIVTARKQQKAKEASIGITNTQLNFNRDIQRIFLAFESLMREPSPALIGSKTLIVQHMHTWLPELKECFSHDEIVRTAVGFVDACADVHGKLILHKLVLIRNLTKLIEMPQSALKIELEKKIAHWIAPYWGVTSEITAQYRQQVHLCSSIAATQTHPDGTELPYYFVKIVQSYRCLQATTPTDQESLTLLFPIAYPFPTRPIAKGVSFDENLVELSALLAGFSTQALSREISLNADEITDILSSALEMNMSVLRGDAFPSSWLTLYVYHHHSILQMLERISEIMQIRYLPSPEEADNFDTVLWKTLLTTLLRLVRSEALGLETFPEQKRRAVWKIAGDVREQGAVLLNRMWDAIGWDTNMEEQRLYGLRRLGGYQVQYVPSLVAPIVELCLSVHVGLRAVAVKILESMIVSEWELNEDLAVVQAEMVDCLDQLYKSRDISEVAQQKLFVNELLDLFEPIARIPDSLLWEAIKELVSTIDELLDLLVAVHSPDTTEAFRIMHTLRLMDFLKGMQKEAIYVRYVHQLADVQIRSRNATEAGLALFLHAELYPWDTSRVVDALFQPAFPKQTAFERRESLYFEMIKHFEEGSAWQSALASYRELAHQYEFVLFDFAKLARTHRSIANIFEIVARGESISPRYFRVVYLGLGFPIGLRDKQFIFEGHGSERLTAFTDRLQQQHPTAQLIPHGDVHKLEGQFLQVSAVNTHRDLSQPLYQRSKVAQPTRDFILSAQPDQFTITSKRHSPKHDVKDQWIEKTVYTTADKFPTILRRSEVVDVNVIALSPLQTAVERTTRKTSELTVLERRILEGDDSSFFNLTDAIKSSVNPTSTTSVAQYRELLPQLEAQDEEDEMASLRQTQPLENALKIALLDFASTLRRSLNLYSRPEHRATRTDFIAQFSSTFAPELAVLTPIAAISQNTLSPSTPFAIEYTAPHNSHEHSDNLTSGRTQTTESTAPDFAPNASTTDPTEANTRSRFGFFLKRMNTSESQPATNGTTATSHPKASSELRSMPSSRHTSPSRGQERSASHDESQNGFQSAQATPVRSNGRGRTNSDARPVTAQSRPFTAKSAATVTSTTSSPRTGSLRKRLSTLGIGKKANKTGYVGNENGVLTEE